jgi:DNA-binding transcriptional regulator YdaS (Cro superfamily)
MKIKHKYILEELFRRIGSQSEVSRLLGVSRQYVSAWDKVPLTHVEALSEASKIPKKILRPDIYD